MTATGPAGGPARRAPHGLRLEDLCTIWLSTVTTGSESAPFPVTEHAPTRPETAMIDHPGNREPELLTITEAAELLRAPVATLRYWRHLGTGPRSFRLGHRVLYRADDLRSWIETQRGVSPSAPSHRV